MKRRNLIIILILICFALVGCASSGTAGERNDSPVSQAADDGDYGQFDEPVDPTTDGGNYVPDEDTPSYYLSDEPKFEDFDFYGDITVNGVPEDAYYPSLKYAEGKWEYDLRFRYDTYEGYYFDEIGYADLSLDYDKETVIIVLHPWYANDGYETWEESDESVGYEPFEGGFDENDQLKLIGNDCVINLEEYYDYSGREYILGTFWVSEEAYGIFMMTRGQN